VFSLGDRKGGRGAGQKKGLPMRKEFGHPREKKALSQSRDALLGSRKKPRRRRGDGLSVGVSKDINFYATAMSLAKLKRGEREGEILVLYITEQKLREDNRNSGGKDRRNKRERNRLFCRGITGPKNVHVVPEGVEQPLGMRKKWW